MRRAHLKSKNYTEQVDPEKGQDGLSGLLELNGWAVRLTIDAENLSWVPTQTRAEYFPVPSMSAKHAAGCPYANANDLSPSASSHKPPRLTPNEVPFRDILSASIGEPINKAAPKCCGPVTKFTLHQLVVHIVKRGKRKHNVWHIADTAFQSPSQEIVRNWCSAINGRVAELSERPSRLLVIVNPYGGAKAARSTWNNLLQAVFQKAGVKCDVKETEHQNHGHEIIQALPVTELAQLDGIVAVGGDGLFHEVVNGLLAVREQGGERALHAAYIRAGHIPAGSTDAVSCSLHGTRDETTAALHIALGDRCALDALRVDTEDGTHRYIITMAAYGYMGDLMRDSERLRWLGPLRYELVGAQRLVQLKSYKARVSYLPAEAQSNGDVGKVCHVGCDVCRSFRESTLHSSNFMQHSSVVLEHRPESWKVEDTEFQAVMVLVPCCRSNKSPRGVAPMNHLSDGKALLVLVRKCTPLQYARFLLELAAVGARKGRFAFVEVVNISAVKVEPQGEESSWNCDGELLENNHVTAQVHGGVLDVFARGVEP